MILLPDSPAQRGRRYLYLPRRTELFDGVLVVRVGAKSRDVYIVQALGGGVYLCEKVNKPRPEFGPYLVETRSLARAGECSCQGFGRWGSCKHLDSLNHALGETL